MATTSSLPDASNASRLGPTRLLQKFEPLTYDRYWRYGLLRPDTQYAFYRNVNSAPIGVSEFAQISAHLPIVFMDDDKQHPYVVLGLLPHINLALSHKDVWRTGLYQPNYIRLYPFGSIVLQEQRTEGVFSDSVPIPEDQDSMSHNKTLLAIDTSTPLLVPMQNNPDATPLFEQDGSVTPVVTQMIALQSTLKRDQVATSSFLAAMRANKLLSEKSIKIHFDDNTTLTVSGFSTISRTKFNQLSPTVIERWKELGYLSLIEHHWNSQKKWGLLIALHERRMSRDLRALRKKRGAMPPFTSPDTQI